MILLLYGILIWLVTGVVNVATFDLVGPFFYPLFNSRVDKSAAASRDRKTETAKYTRCILLAFGPFFTVLILVALILQISASAIAEFAFKRQRK